MPEEFCQRFCCAFIAGNCLAMNAAQGECLWSATQAIESMDRNKNRMTRELFAWMQSLRRDRA